MNVSIIRMYQYVRNNNVHINVSNKEFNNIDLKLRKKKNNKMRERKKVSLINFLCNPQED